MLLKSFRGAELRRKRSMCLYSTSGVPGAPSNMSPGMKEQSTVRAGMRTRGDWLHPEFTRPKLKSPPAACSQRPFSASLTPIKEAGALGDWLSRTGSGNLNGNPEGTSLRHSKYVQRDTHVRNSLEDQESARYGVRAKFSPAYSCTPNSRGAQPCPLTHALSMAACAPQHS